MGRGKSWLTDVTPLMCSSAACGADVLGFLALSASVPGRLQLFCLHSEPPQDSLSRAAVVVGWLQHRWSAHASLSRSVVSDSVTPWIVALQAYLSVGFSARTLERVVMPPPGHLPALAGGCVTTGAACRGCHTAACSVHSPACAVWHRGVSARAPAGLCSEPGNPHLQQE